MNTVQVPTLDEYLIYLKSIDIDSTIELKQSSSKKPLFLVSCSTHFLRKFLCYLGKLIELVPQALDSVCKYGETNSINTCTCVCMEVS